MFRDESMWKGAGAAIQGIVALWQGFIDTLKTVFRKLPKPLRKAFISTVEGLVDVIKGFAKGLVSFVMALGERETEDTLLGSCSAGCLT